MLCDCKANLQKSNSYQEIWREYTMYWKGNFFKKCTHEKKKKKTRPVGQDTYRWASSCMKHNRFTWPCDCLATPVMWQRSLDMALLSILKLTSPVVISYKNSLNSPQRLVISSFCNDPCKPVSLRGGKLKNALAMAAVVTHIFPPIAKKAACFTGKQPLTGCLYQSNRRKT